MTEVVAPVHVENMLNITASNVKPSLKDRVRNLGEGAEEALDWVGRLLVKVAALLKIIDRLF